MNSYQKKGKKSKPFKGKVFRDPVHDLITIGKNSKVILQLIDTPEFQRLRRIKQLGFCSYTYHGAEHSRFSHSMGVFHSARRMVNALIRRYINKPKYKKILKKHAINIKISALLHDLGHGPFSHAFEHAIKSSKKHEDWTVEIIKNPQGHIKKILKGNNIDPEEIVNIIKEKVREPFVVDIVSSQIDADKMDYLLRDSLMTGTEYGNFDYEWMLHALRIGEVEIKSEGSNSLETVHKLCIDGSKGIHSVEEYVLARLFMYMQVYFHKTTRAYEALLINILRFANHIVVQKRKKTPSGTHKLIDKIVRQNDLKIKEYLELDDILFMNTLKNWSAYDGKDNDLKELATMSTRLLSRGTPYKYIDLSDEEKKMGAHTLVGILDDRFDPLRFYCHFDQAKDTPYKGILYEMKSKGSEEKVVKPIYTLGKGSEVPSPIELNPESILESFGGKKFEKARFFYDRSKENDFKPLMKEHKIIQ